MATQFPISQMVDDIRQIYESDRLEAESLIETYLNGRLNRVSITEKLKTLDDLLSEFNETPPCSSEPIEFQKEIFSQLCSLVLGERVSQVDFSSPELCRRLADSLNTIFDTLNRLVTLINTTLFAHCREKETIRTLISSDLRTEIQGESLESYLGQISRAFLISQEAFKEAATTMVKKILHEIHPENISNSRSGGFKVGPFRKAELFKIYEEKYRKCETWSDSGLFIREFLREFEKNCQRISGY
jgi:phosphopantetheine adenylyltransferase